MAAQCYSLDGSRAAADFAPCNPDADVSPCCALKKVNPDICLSSGLCLAQQDGLEGVLYENACTDKTGKSDKCANICPNNPSSDGTVHASLNVLLCSPGQYCCRAVNSADNCCGSKDAVFSLQVGKIPQATTVTVGSSAAIPTSTVTSCAASPTAASGNLQPACKKDNSALVGGIVGGILGAAILALLLVVAKLSRGKRDATSSEVVPTKTELPAHSIHEMPGSTPTA